MNRITLIIYVLSNTLLALCKGHANSHTTITRGLMLLMLSPLIFQNKLDKKQELAKPVTIGWERIRMCLSNVFVLCTQIRWSDAGERNVVQVLLGRCIFTHIFFYIICIAHIIIPTHMTFLSQENINLNDKRSCFGGRRQKVYKKCIPTTSQRLRQFLICEI